MATLNSSQVSHFILGAYVDVGPFRYASFLLVLVLYVVIVCANVFVVAVIGLHRRLHEPMFLFLCSLLLNELYGSTGLFPLLLLQILSDVHVVSVPLCFLQILCLYSYGGVEFSMLAVMAYDRYLAICRPLQYSRLMTGSRMAALTALIWIYPLLVNLFIVYFLTASLTLCGNVINKVYCDNFYVVKLSCSDITLNNVFGLVHMFTVIFGLILLILYTYVRILVVCFSGSKQTRQKALSTCTPHLASLMNFSFGCFFEIVGSRFDMYNLPSMLRVALSLYWLTFQPLINPLVYGLKMSKIRSAGKSLLFGQKRERRFS